jgi:hypothetical protein
VSNSSERLYTRKCSGNPNLTLISLKSQMKPTTPQPHTIHKKNRHHLLSKPLFLTGSIQK